VFCGGFPSELLRKIDSRSVSGRCEPFFVSDGLVSHDMSLELPVVEVVKGGVDTSLELSMLDVGEVGDMRRRASDMSFGICDR